MPAAGRCEQLLFGMVLNKHNHSAMVITVQMVLTGRASYKRLPPRVGVCVVSFALEKHLKEGGVRPAVVLSVQNIGRKITVP